MSPPAKRRRLSAEDRDSETDTTPKPDNTNYSNHSSNRSSRSPHSSRSSQSSPNRQLRHESSSNLDYATPRSHNSTPPATHQPSTDFSFISLFALPRIHARGITATKISPDCSLLATGSADGTIKIYTIPPSPQADTPWSHLRTLRAHLAGINALSWSPVGSPHFTLASASDDKTILLWSPITSDFPIRPSPLTGHHNYVYSLAFSPKGNMLVSGSHDEAVFLWDVRSGKIMRQLPAHSDPVSGVDFVRDGTMVVSCAGDGLIRIWDAGTGQCLKTLVHEDRKAVTSVRFSPNGKYVLAWTLDNCVRLWRYMGPGGDCVKTYQGHVNEKFSLSGCMGDYSAIDEEGRQETRAFIVSGSENGEIIVWDVNSKEILWREKAHRDVVLSIDWARLPDGRGVLASVGKDKDLRVWIEESPVSENFNDVQDEKELEGHMVKMEIKREETIDEARQ